MRWMLLTFLVALVGCRARVAEDGQPGYVVQAVAPLGETGGPLLAVADGLAASSSEGVLVLRSLKSVIDTFGLAVLLERPAVQAELAALKAALGFDLLAALDHGRPLVLVGAGETVVGRVPMTGAGLEALRAFLGAWMSEGREVAFAGFSGRALVADGAETCVLWRTGEAPEVVFAAGDAPPPDGEACQGLGRRLATPDATWRKGPADLEQASRGALIAIFHGDTRSYGDEPVGVAWVDALSAAAPHASKGVFLLGAPAGELGLEYHSVPADEVLRDRTRAARAALPPARLSPATDTLYLQLALSPAQVKLARLPLFEPIMDAIQALGWPADTPLAVLLSMSQQADATFAVALADDTLRGKVLAKVGAESADFADEKAWRLPSRVQCGAGPESLLVCATDRTRLSGALARLRQSGPAAEADMFIHIDAAGLGELWEAGSTFAELRKAAQTFSLENRVGDRWSVTRLRVTGRGKPFTEHLGALLAWLLPVFGL
ncbi:MAG: hypothetical protein H6706_13745 [Myxococcales bacterium]|nr:hypothetical protein [Myxococcales bacterium]